MKINNYTLTYDPQGLEEGYASEMDEVLVPFDDYIIFDQGTIQKNMTFDMVLVDNEIDIIYGMLEASRIIHLSFKDFDGFFYVTTFDKSWIKYMDSRKLISMKMGGRYIGKSPLLKLSYFLNYQRSDFVLDAPYIVGINNEIATRKSLTPDYSKTWGTYGSLIYYYEDPTEDIKFKAVDNLFADGCFTFSDASGTVYKDKLLWDTYLRARSKTGLLTTVYKSDANKIATLVDGNNTEVLSISDGTNSLADEDITLKPHPFEPVLSAGYINFKPSLMLPIVELETTTPVTWTQRRFCIPTHSDNSVGHNVLTTEDPSTTIYDNTIGGTKPTTVEFMQSPGLINWNTADGYSIVPFSNLESIHPPNGLSPTVERVFIMVSDKVPIFTASTDSWTLSNFTAQTDSGGTTYHGVVDYVDSAVSGAYIEKLKHIPVEGKYDVWCMIKGETPSIIDNIKNGSEDGNINNGFVSVGTSSISSDNTQFYYGARSAKYTSSTSGSGIGTTLQDCAPGCENKFKVRVKGSGTVKVRISERTSGDAEVGYTDSGTVTLSSGWQQITVTRTFGATGVKVRLQILNTAATAVTLYSDDYQFFPTDSNKIKLYIDTVEKASATLYEDDGLMARYMYLGGYTLTHADHTFKITRESGKIGLYYLLIVPYDMDTDFAPHKTICSHLLDVKTAYEVD